MSLTRLSPLCLILVFASSALSHWDTYVHPAFQPPLSFSPHLVYSQPGFLGGNADLTGFSYFTKDLGHGAESDVVFFTGPNSGAKMTEEVAAVKDQMSSLPSASTDETKSDKVEETSGSSEDKETPEIAQPAKEEEATPNTEETKKEDKKKPTTLMGIISGEFLAEKKAGFEAPYPILRLSGGATSYYPQSSFSGFGGYEPTDYFRSQYLPVYNHYNSYQSIYNPLYSSPDTDYWNPDVFRTVYDSPILTPFSPAATQGNFITEKPEEKTESLKNAPAVPMSKIDRRFKEGEKPSADMEQENSGQKDAEEASSSEKGTELPTTSTEQAAEAAEISTTVSEAAPTTADAEIKEDTTTVADSAAEP